MKGHRPPGQGLKYEGLPVCGKAVTFLGPQALTEARACVASSSVSTSCASVETGKTLD